MLEKKTRVGSKERPRKLFRKIKRMTPERLKSFEGFENVSDMDAKKAIFAMEELCKVIYNHLSTKK